MQRKYIGIGLIVISFFLANCGEEKTDAEINYQLTTDNQGNIHDIFSEVEIIPLEFAGDYYPHRGIKALKVVDNIICIEDNPGGVHLFSDKGVYIGSSLSQIGQGPDEFTIFMGHSINPADSTVQIVTPNQLIKYDYHFNKVRSAKIPTKIGKDGLLFHSIYDLTDSVHLLLPTSISKNPYRVFKYNSITEELTEIYSFDKEITAAISMQPRCFTRDKDGTLLFIPPAFTGHIYEVDCGEEWRFRKKIRIQMPDSFLSGSEFKALGRTTQERAKRILSAGKEFPLRIDISSEYIFVLSTDGGSLRDMRYTIIDRESGECRTCDLYRDDMRIFPLIEDVDGEYAYAAIEKELLETYGTLMLDDDAKMAELKRTEPESLILLKYKMTDCKK